MKLEDVKLYLRIDGDEEDALIQSMMQAGAEYIRSAVGKYDDTDPTAQILLAAIVQNMYDNRELMQSEQQMKKRIEYTAERSEVMESKAKDVMGLISAEDLDLTEYSDALVYRIIERITVLSKEEIRIRFVGGFEITQPLH